ncbi:MAG TPA: hypothetical protein VF601_04170 [Beijerinckiaceae bacterium]|jgi:hypothetical protein
MLEELVIACEKTAAAITNIAGIVEKNIRSAYEISDYIKARRQLNLWTRLLWKIESLYGLQRSIPESLRVIAEQILPRNEEYARYELAKAFDEIACFAGEVKKLLQDSRNELIFENVRLYDDLLTGMNFRIKFFEILEREQFTVHQGAVPTLLRLAEVYEEMIRKLQGNRDSLAELVKAERPKRGHCR